MNKVNVIVIRTESESETEWGISFTCSNPEAEDYFNMPDKDTAFSLSNYLNNTLELSKKPT